MKDIIRATMPNAVVTALVTLVLGLAYRSIKKRLGKRKQQKEDNEIINKVISLFERFIEQYSPYRPYLQGGKECFALKLDAYPSFKDPINETDTFCLGEFAKFFERNINKIEKMVKSNRELDDIELLQGHLKELNWLIKEESDIRKDVLSMKQNDFLFMKKEDFLSDSELKKLHFNINKRISVIFEILKKINTMFAKLDSLAPKEMKYTEKLEKLKNLNGEFENMLKKNEREGYNRDMGYISYVYERI
jgi:hypothetical protein